MSKRLIKLGIVLCVLFFINGLLFILVEYKHKKETNIIQEKVLILNIDDNSNKVDKTGIVIDSDKVKNIENLVIVAHPDDETFWGGDFISKERSLVLCITNGTNTVRKEEFFHVMKETNNYGIMLEYPDNPRQIQDNWNGVKESIYNDLEYIVKYKSWKRIVTHNPDGEYGHLQHKFTSMMVTNMCVETKKIDNLYYFEKYKTREKVKDEALVLTTKEIYEKNKLMQMYTSQAYSYQIFKHMSGYEKLIPYKDWYF